VPLYMRDSRVVNRSEMVREVDFYNGARELGGNAYKLITRDWMGLER
jgi:hypothetical protein